MLRTVTQTRTRTTALTQGATRRVFLSRDFRSQSLLIRLLHDDGVSMELQDEKIVVVRAVRAARAHYL